MTITIHHAATAVQNEYKTKTITGFISSFYFHNINIIYTAGLFVVGIYFHHFENDYQLL